MKQLLNKKNTNNLVKTLLESEYLVNPMFKTAFVESYSGSMLPVFLEQEFGVKIQDGYLIEADTKKVRNGILSRIWNYLKDKAKAIGGAIGSILNAVWTLIKATWPLLALGGIAYMTYSGASLVGLAKKVSDMGSGLVQYIKTVKGQEVVSGMAAKHGAVGAEISDKLRGAAAKSVESTLAGDRGLFAKLKMMFEYTVKFIYDMCSKVIKTKSQELGTALKGVKSETISKVGEKLSNIDTTSAYENASEAAKKAAKESLTIGKRINMIVNSLVNFGKAVGGVVKKYTNDESFTGKSLNYISSSIKSVATNLTKWGKYFMTLAGSKEDMPVPLDDINEINAMPKKEKQMKPGSMQLQK